MKAIKIILFVVVVIFMLKFLAQVDVVIIWKQLSQISEGFMLMLFVTFLGYLAASVAWFLCIPQRQTIGISSIFSIRHIGETIALLNPTNIIAGEAVKVSYLKDYGISGESAVSSILISRSMLIISSLFLLLISTIVLLSKIISLSFIIVLASVTLVVIFCLGYSITSDRLLLSSLYNRICKLFPKIKSLESQKEKIQKINLQLAEFSKNKPYILALVFGLSLVHWVTGAVELFIIFYLLDITINIMDCISMEMGVMVFKSLGSFIPGQLGVEEYGNKVMIESLGVSFAGLWITVSLLRRARQLFWIIIGIVLYVYISLANYFTTTSMSKS